MRFIIAAILVLLVVSIPTVAEARHHHRHYVRSHHQVDRPTFIRCAAADANGNCVHKRYIVKKRGKVHTKVAKRGRSRELGTGPTTELIAKARGYDGMTSGQIGLHLARRWCAAFLRYLGVQGPVDNRAISFLNLPHTGPQVGAIAVYPHHVGIVTGFSGSHPIIISGNSNGRRVYEGPYYRRPLAYVSGGEITRLSVHHRPPA